MNAFRTAVDYLRQKTGTLRIRNGGACFFDSVLIEKVDKKFKFIWVMLNYMEIRYELITSCYRRCISTKK